MCVCSKLQFDLHILLNFSSRSVYNVQLLDTLGSFSGKLSTGVVRTFAWKQLKLRQCGLLDMTNGRGWVWYLAHLSLNQITLKCWFCGTSVFHSFLQYSRTPSWSEIPDIPEILIIWIECPDIGFCYAIVTTLPLFCTWLHHIWTLLLLVLLAYLLTYYSFALVGLFYSRCLQQFSTFYTNHDLLDWLRFASTENRTFSVSWASWNRQKCHEIY